MKSHRIRERVDLSAGTATTPALLVLASCVAAGSLLVLLSARRRVGSSEPELEAAAGAALAARRPMPASSKVRLGPATRSRAASRGRQTTPGRLGRANRPATS